MRAVFSGASALAFPFTVIEVVHIGLQRGRSGPCDAVALAALAKVGLNGYAGRSYQELPGGEQLQVQLHGFWRMSGNQFKQGTRVGCSRLNRFRLWILRTNYK